MRRESIPLRGRHRVADVSAYVVTRHCVRAWRAARVMVHASTNVRACLCSKQSHQQRDQRDTQYGNTLITLVVPPDWTLNSCNGGPVV